MKISVIGAIAFISALPAASGAAPSIEHKSVGCVIAEKFPRLEARLTPMDAVARVRVFFRAEGSAAWYSVSMTPQGDTFAAHLPKPKKSLPGFTYYIEAADTGMTTSRTPERSTKVVDGEGACEANLMGLASTVATVLLEVPAGAAAVPAGFSSTGIVAAAAGAQTAGAAGAASAASGGGLGTAAVVGGAVVVAGGLGAAVVAGGLGGDEDGENSNANDESSEKYDVTFPSPGIDVSICAGRPMQWCCQPVNVQKDGSFDDTWNKRDGDILRVTGNLTPTTFTASLRCTNGAASGTLNATGSGGSYSGSFEFAGQRGPATITK